MSELIKEEILGTISKKRFIILIAFTFIGAFVSVYTSKGDYWNDLLYLSAIEEYLFYFFNTLAGSILILSTYRKKYTPSSILQVEEKGAKRYEGVLSRFISGSVILIGCYLIFALVFLVLGLVFGAHNTPEQIGNFIMKIFLDCIASVAAYSAALFWLYLFAFPIVPIFYYVLIMVIAPADYKLTSGYRDTSYWIFSYIFPKITSDDAYTHFVFADSKLLSAIIFILEITVPLLLTVFVFNLKKLKPIKEEKVSAACEQKVDDTQE